MLRGLSSSINKRVRLNKKNHQMVDFVYGLIENILGKKVDTLISRLYIREGRVVVELRNKIVATELRLKKGQLEQGLKDAGLSYKEIVFK